MKYSITSVLLILVCAAGNTGAVAQHETKKAVSASCYCTGFDMRQLPGLNC